jgi:tetratricopeptide (TPR) repeat protein
MNHADPSAGLSQHPKQQHPSDGHPSIAKLLAGARHWRSWIAGLLLITTSSWGSIASAQALFRVPQPDPALLEAQGLQLASDAIRLAQFGQTDEALTRLQLATELVPASPELLVVLGSLHLELKNYPEAVQALQKARDLTPKDADVLLTLGSAYLRQGSYFAAVDALERGMALKPADANGHFQLGNAYLLRGDGDKAKEEFEAAIRLDKSFWPAINNIGLLEYKAGNIDEAIARWQAALEIDKEAAEPTLALATAYYIQGRTEEAEQLGVRAIQLDPNYGKVEVLRENLWDGQLMRDVQILLQTAAVRNALRQAAVEAQSLEPTEPTE